MEWKQVDISKRLEENDEGQLVSMEEYIPKPGDPIFAMLNKATKRKAPEKPKKKKKRAKISQAVEEEPVSAGVDRKIVERNWKSLGLSLHWLDRLAQLGFSAPTEIQKKVLRGVIVEGKDIIGASPTGTGKTLSYLLPMVQSYAPRTPQVPFCLIILPTRELVMQVKAVLQKLVGPKSDITVGVLIGGLNREKQQRVLSYRPPVILATPGRLWELLSINPDPYLQLLTEIEMLVIDEADRLVERGDYQELDKILSHIYQEPRPTRKTLLLSATLTMKGTVRQASGKHVSTASSRLRKITNSTLKRLIEKIQFREARKTIDLTIEQKLAKGLKEAKIDCAVEEKDIYAYYICHEYPGKTIIFVNSVDCIRRLVPIFTLLGVPAFALHAQISQKSRLFHLEKFTRLKQCVLIATDVAARGIDVAAIDQVIHYQLPLSGEIYIHRSGRTARASASGSSILLMSPQEIKSYELLCKSFNYLEGFPDFPVDREVYRQLRARVKMARKIDQNEHQHRKDMHNKSWIEKQVEELDIVIDEYDFPELTKATLDPFEIAQMKKSTAALKKELNAMLKKKVTRGAGRQRTTEPLNRSSHQVI